MRIRLILTLSIGLFSAPASAVCDGCVVAAVQAASLSITAAIATMNASVTTMLYNVGLAVNQSGNKVSHTIEASAQAARDFSVEQERNRKLYDSELRYQVPNSICSESASGGALPVKNGAVIEKGGLRPGGGGKITNPKIDQAINSPPPASEIDAARSIKIHADYCDHDDYLAFGGTTACPAVSTSMPGADKRIDSVLYGAGPDDKGVDLTFDQDQIDAARMYTQNSIRRSIAPQLRKGEADTAAGAQYLGLMTQYLSIVSAAATPQDKMIANSIPSEMTTELIEEAMQSPSAAAYLEQIASKYAREHNVMSSREYEVFEVGRRYGNTEYQRDLQELSGDNLIREQIRVGSLNAWLLLNIKDEIEIGNIITGQLLASMARQEYEPLLTLKYRDVSGGIGEQ